MLGTSSTEDGIGVLELWRRLRLAFNSPGVSASGVFNLTYAPTVPGIYDVHAYGAIGDGTTDDTAAITAAIAAAGEGVVAFRPGKNYRVTSTLTMTTDDQAWWMYGAEIFVDGAFAGITLGTNTLRVRRGKIYGGIVGSFTGAVNWTAGGCGYRLLKANNCVLRDVSVRFLEKGIEITSPAPPNASETTQNWIYPQMLADCALPIYLFANDSGTVNENTFFGGEISYADSLPTAVGRYAITLDRHASSLGNLNGTKFFGTYVGCSKLSNRPNAVYCAGVGTAFHACHIEGFPIPMVTFAGDAILGTRLPNMWWGGGADYHTPEIDLDSDGVGIASPFIFSGDNGAGIAGGGNAGSAYVWLAKVLGAATKVAFAVKNAADTITATITGEGIIQGTWLRNGALVGGGGTGSLPVVTQVDATTTAFANVLQCSLVTGRVYEFEAILHVTANVTGGSKFRLNASSGLTASAIRYDSTLLDMTTSAYTNTTRSTAFDAVASQAGSTACLWIIRGSLTTTANGDLNLQFAQAVANGTSSVLVGSRFKVWQLN